MSESTDNIAASLHARIETYRADLIESLPSACNFDYLLRLFHGAQALIAYGDEAQLWSPSAARVAFARLDNSWAPHRAAEERRRWPALSAAGLGGAGGGA